MRLLRLHIKNYRCVQDLELAVGSLTSLIGMNGAGKSAVLRAVAAFYGESDSPWPEDFYAPDDPVEVELTFGDLTELERRELQRYVSPEGEIRVARVWWIEEGRVRDAIHGYHLACQEFAPLREASSGVKEMHNSLADSPEFADLHKVTRAADCEEALKEWEQAHVDKCEWIRDSGKFFGWNAVGGYRLQSCSTCVFVPAVREAKADAAEGKGSALTKIVDLVLRGELERNPDLVALREETVRRFEDILGRTSPVLDHLACSLSTLMAELTPGASVGLRWREGAPSLPEWPPIEARLIDDGVEGPVWAKGHGVQRAFILSLLQLLAELGAASDAGEGEGKHIALLIEEPELYQHPIAIRRFSRVLHDLVAQRQDLQILYSTHHPQFVSFDHFDSIRRLRKVAVAGHAPATEVQSLALEEVSGQLVRLGHLDQDAVTDETTRQRLRSVLTPQVSEGFFAQAVVLVEGDQDKAVIEGFALAAERDLSEKGIAVLPVGGKTKLDRAHIVLAGFGVPIFVLWDGDVSDAKGAGGHARTNRVLAELVGLEVEDFPSTQVGKLGAVFSDKLETELRAAVGDEFDDLVNECAVTVGLPPGRDVLKTAYGCREFVLRLKSQGRTAPLLEQIVDVVWDMVP